MLVLTCVLDLRRRYLLWTGVVSRLAVVQRDILYVPYFDGYRLPLPLCYYSRGTMLNPRWELMVVPVATGSEWLVWMNPKVSAKNYLVDVSNGYITLGRRAVFYYHHDG